MGSALLIHHSPRKFRIIVKKSIFHHKFKNPFFITSSKMAHFYCVELKKSEFRIFFSVVFRFKSCGTHSWSLFSFPIAFKCSETEGLLKLNLKASSLTVVQVFVLLDPLISNRRLY